MLIKKKIKKVLAIITGISCCVLAVYLFILLRMSMNSTPTLLNQILPILNQISPIVLGVVVVCVVTFMDGDSPIRKYIKYKRWDSFGNRMKVAYEAKFGYSNSAFNKEVDQHVLAMRALGKGYTKDIDKAWMKRMAKFVEVPFIIPEEEKLAEVDKTRSFGAGI